MSASEYRAVALLVVLLSITQVLFFTTIRNLPPLGIALTEPLSFLRRWETYVVVLCAAGTLLISFALVRASGSALVLAMAYQANNILMGFVLLPVTWRVVYDEPVFSTTSRVVAYVILAFSATGVGLAAYLWNLPAETP